MLIQFGCTATILGVAPAGHSSGCRHQRVEPDYEANSGQFVELFGDEGTNLDDHSLVLLKSATSGGNFTPEVQAAIGLDGQSLDEDGFLLIQGSGWQNTVVAVVLAGSPVSEFPIGSTPTFSAVTDAVFFGSVGPTPLKWRCSSTLWLRNDSNGARSEQPCGQCLGGPRWIVQGARRRVGVGHGVCDAGAEPRNHQCAAMRGGHLSLNNPDVATYCTDLGPEIVVFTHETDSPTDSTSLAVLDETTGELLAVFPGSAMNMEGFGYDTLLVYAISRDVALTDDWTSLDAITSVSGDGCISVVDEPIVLIGRTCETPSCDGGTMLTAGAELDTEACLTEDGALVSFGYYSDAVEGEYVFLVCDDDDNILDTTDEPYFDFATFGSAGTYHVWGLSYQEGLDLGTVAAGLPVSGASAFGCDSLSLNALEVNILQCGSAGLCDDLIISEYVEGTSNNKARCTTRRLTST